MIFFIHKILTRDLTKNIEPLKTIIIEWIDFEKEGIKIWGIDRDLCVREINWYDINGWVEYSNTNNL